MKSWMRNSNLQLKSASLQSQVENAEVMHACFSAKPVSGIIFTTKRRYILTAQVGISPI